MLDISAYFQQTPPRAFFGFRCGLHKDHGFRHQGSGVDEGCQKSGKENCSPLQTNRQYESHNIFRREQRNNFNGKKIANQSVQSDPVHCSNRRRCLKAPNLKERTDQREEHSTTLGEVQEDGIDLIGRGVLTPKRIAVVIIDTSEATDAQTKRRIRKPFTVFGGGRRRSSPGE